MALGSHTTRQFPIVGLLFGLVLSIVLACDDPTGVDATPRPSRVRFLPIAAFEAHDFPYRMGWSPVGATLVFNAGGGLYAFDASRPEVPPWQVLNSGVTYASWSPDGTWVSFKLTTDWRRGLSTLNAIPITGGAPTMLVGPARLGHHVWGASGAIYYWEGESDVRRRVEPPIPVRPGPASLVHFVSVMDPELRAMRPHVLRTLPRESEWILARLDPARFSWVLEEEVFPDGRRFLVRVLDEERQSVYSMVVDAAGDRIVEFTQLDSGEGFSAASVSANGRYVVGYDAVDDGHVILSSKIYLADASNAWRVPIEGTKDGLDTALSRTGLFLAYLDPLDSHVYVGSLAIDYTAGE